MGPAPRTQTSLCIPWCEAPCLSPLADVGGGSGSGEVGRGPDSDDRRARQPSGILLFALLLRKLFEIFSSAAAAQILIRISRNVWLGQDVPGTNETPVTDTNHMPLQPYILTNGYGADALLYLSPNAPSRLRENAMRVATKRAR